MTILNAFEQNLQYLSALTKLGFDSDDYKRWRLKWKNLKEFCVQHRLDSAAMGRALNGVYKTHKGWTGVYL